MIQIPRILKAESRSLSGYHLLVSIAKNPQTAKLPSLVSRERREVIHRCLEEVEMCGECVGGCGAKSRVLSECDERVTKSYSKLMQ